jgi:phage terminase small subunit
MVVTARDDAHVADDDDARACRAYLRARAMRVWRELVRREVEITLRGDGAPAATGVFAGVDAAETTFLVESLTSALGTTPKARVRWSDVLSLRFGGSRDEDEDDDDDDARDG